MSWVTRGDGSPREGLPQRGGNTGRQGLTALTGTSDISRSVLTETVVSPSSRLRGALDVKGPGTQALFLNRDRPRVYMG